MAKLLINDGYTLDGTVHKSPWPKVCFRYRPALPEDVLEYFAGRKDSGKSWLSAMVAILIKQLVSWDVTDEADNLVPINQETLRRVPQPVLSDMVGIVTGWDAGGDAKN